MNAVDSPPARIALDGPAAAGKSTVGRRLAEEIGALYFDTGALYRGLAVIALEQGLDPNDGDALGDLAGAVDMTIAAAPGSALGYRLVVDARDISAGLRRPEVDRCVSAISRHPRVREAMLGLQRDLALRGPVVMVGRDIGTVVMPDADVKIFLLAAGEERARRRFRERLRDGFDGTFADVLAEQESRDSFDAGRTIAPLVPAANAVVVDTGGCGVEAVVAHLAAIVRRWPDTLSVEGGASPCTDTSLR